MRSGNILAVGLVTIILGVNSVSAITDEYITKDNINLWKRESEQFLKTDLELKELKKILYQAQWPSGDVSAQDKAYLKDFEKRAVKAVYNKANRLYVSGDYLNSLNYYQIVTSKEIYADKNDLIKTYLNSADIYMKQGKKGAKNKVTQAISKSPSDINISEFIDKNIMNFSYNDIVSIAFAYSAKSQQTNAIKYYKKAMDIAPNETERAKMQSNISICEGQHAKAVKQAERPKVQVSQNAGAEANQLFVSAIKKYNYSDITGALNDIEQAHKLNPNSGQYDILCPIFEISANSYNSAIKHLNTVIEYEIVPFRETSSNYHTAYELRGSLKLLSGDYTGAISDYRTALKNGAGEYDNAWQGLIISYLINGDIETAKTEINKYNARSYYQFADCTTYSNKILLDIGYREKIAYDPNLKNEFINYALNNSLSSYAYKISNIYGNDWGNTYININRNR